jgi:enoyl-[acyl-carrier-protein] reductase (NADH)
MTTEANKQLCRDYFTADDLVGTAVYMLSDLSGFVSGQTLVVDGGHIMY